MSIAFFMFCMTKYKWDWELTTIESNMPHIDNTSSFLVSLSSFTWLNIKSVTVLTFLLVSLNFRKYICLNSFLLLSVSPLGIFFSIASITHSTTLSGLLLYRSLSISHNWFNLHERFLCMKALFAKSTETNSLATWSINVMSWNVTNSVVDYCFYVHTVDHPRWLISIFACYWIFFYLFKTYWPIRKSCVFAPSTFLHLVYLQFWCFRLYCCWHILMRLFAKLTNNNGILLWEGQRSLHNQNIKQATKK